MDTEHKPLPWTKFDGSIYDANGRLVATVAGESDNGHFVIDTAALIVHSVNLLPELVEALREARPHVAHSTISVAGAVGRRSATEIAATIDALLAKATS